MTRNHKFSWIVCGGRRGIPANDTLGNVARNNVVPNTMYYLVVDARLAVNPRRALRGSQDLRPINTITSLYIIYVPGYIRSIARLLSSNRCIVMRDPMRGSSVIYRSKIDLHS
jgi:hypothetical protein